MYDFINLIICIFLLSHHHVNKQIHYFHNLHVLPTRVHPWVSTDLLTVLQQLKYTPSNFGLVSFT